MVHTYFLLYPPDTFVRLNCLALKILASASKFPENIYALNIFSEDIFWHTPKNKMAAITT